MRCVQKSILYDFKSKILKERGENSMVRPIISIITPVYSLVERVVSVAQNIRIVILHQIFD